MEEMKIKLMEDSISQEEISAINKCLESGQYTQGKIVEEFEKKFAEWNGSKYAVMVNSGSSANLLIIAALKEKFNLKQGDEILVPNVTWPTTVYPIIQNGLVPVFCDVDESYAISLESINKMIGEKTRAIFAVHLLGQPAKIREIKEICRTKKLLLIEDCCESQGSTSQEIKVGNFGLMGSFSFYFGHHMTTIEGGMITTNDFELYDILKSLRSHGWIRGTEREKMYPEFKNKSFVFDLLGYNLRSTNINAAIGLVQLKKLDEFIKKRKENHEYFLNKIKELSIVPQKVDLNETSSFSFGILTKTEKQREFLLEDLPKKGIECRPIVAGNLLKQPVFQNLALKKDSEEMANKIHSQGIYLPNNQFINEEKINYLVENLKESLSKSEEIDMRNKKILVTGGRGFLGKALVPLLEQEGAEVITFSSKDYDLRKEEDVKKIFEDKKPQIVIHLAVDGGGIGYMKDHPGSVFYNNIMMNTLIQHHAYKSCVEKFVGIGTVCSYPKFAPVPFKEEDLWKGYPEETNAPYGLAKKMMMLQSQGYGEQYGFQAIHLLLVNLYGPYDDFDLKESHVIPALIRKFIEAKETNKENVTLWGTGSASREFLYVKDAAKAILLATKKYNCSDPINIGSGCETTIKELAETIKEIVGYLGQLVWDTSKPDGQPKRFLDVSKARERTGFVAETDLKEGLKKTIEWYREQKLRETYI